MPHGDARARFRVPARRVPAGSPSSRRASFMRTGFVSRTATPQLCDAATTGPVFLAGSRASAAVPTLERVHRNGTLVRERGANTVYNEP